MGDRGNRFCWMEIDEQEGAIQVPLHGSAATDALMPALRQGFFHLAVAVMTVPGQSSGTGSKFPQGAALLDYQNYITWVPFQDLHPIKYACLL